MLDEKFKTNICIAISKGTIFECSILRTMWNCKMKLDTSCSFLRTALHRFNIVSFTNVSNSYSSDIVFVHAHLHWISMWLCLSGNGMRSVQVMTVSLTLVFSISFGKKKKKKERRRRGAHIISTDNNRTC